MTSRLCRAVLWLYCAYLLIPLYWLLNLSLRSNDSIAGGVELIPAAPTLANYSEIFTNPVWFNGFANSLSYVVLNSLISLAVAIPAAYTFSRYRFLGDKHLFFWLLTNRMAPPAVFLLPFFQLYSTLGLFDTPLAVALAHCLFTVPLSVWILEGFFSATPRSVDELARLDGHTRGYFFFRIFLPMNRAALGVTLFFCFMFSWVELLLARTLTGSDSKPIAVVMTRTVSASGLDWGVLCAAGVLTIVPGLIVVYFVRRHLAAGFALGRVS
ncbi:MAG: carbohydrate ABC transporter permease [Pseudomonadota bacterium]